jgi:hypothetical protein
MSGSVITVKTNENLYYKLIIQQPLLAVFALRGRIEVFGDKSISSPP